MKSDEFKNLDLEKDEHIVFVETDKTIVKDRPIKSLAKAISWRIVGTMDTMIVSFIITGELVLAVSIGGIEVFTKIALYYFHERLWARMRWGRVLARLRRNTPMPKHTFNKVFSVKKIRHKNN